MRHLSSLFAEFPVTGLSPVAGSGGKSGKLRRSDGDPLPPGRVEGSVQIVAAGFG
ncbi:hypothetical protein [Planifilum fimeticola]|jgi:hypothetical protein